MKNDLKNDLTNDPKKDLKKDLKKVQNGAARPAELERNRVRNGLFQKALFKVPI